MTACASDSDTLTDILCALFLRNYVTSMYIRICIYVWCKLCYSFACLTFTSPPCNVTLGYSDSRQCVFAYEMLSNILLGVFSALLFVY